MALKSYIKRHIYYGSQKPPPRPACIEPCWDTDADALNIQKCSLLTGLQTMVVLILLIKTTWAVLVKPGKGYLKGCQEAFQNLKQSWKRPVGYIALRAFSRSPRPPSKKLKKHISEDRSKGLSSSYQPSFCSSLGLFKAGQGLLAF